MELLKHVSETGSIVSKAQSGRPKVVTRSSEDQYIELSRDKKVT